MSSLSRALVHVQPVPFEACRGTLGSGAAGGGTAAKKSKTIVLKDIASVRPATSPTFASTKLLEVTRALRQLLAADLSALTSGAPSAHDLNHPPTIGDVQAKTAAAAPGAGAGMMPLITMHRTVDALVSLGRPSSGLDGAVSIPAATLYERVKMELERAAGTLSGILRAGSSSSSSMVVDADGIANVGNEEAEREVAWLRRVAELWTEWCTKMVVVEDVLVSLDRYYVPSQPNLLSVRELSFDLLKNKIFEDEQISGRLYAGIALAVNAMRSEQISSTYKSVHITLLQMASTLDHLEPVQQSLLNASQTFFASKARTAFERSSAESATATPAAVDWISNVLDVADHWIRTEEEWSSWLWSPAPALAGSALGDASLGRQSKKRRAGATDERDENLEDSAVVKKKALRIVEDTFVIVPIETIINELPLLLDTISPKLQVLYQLLSRPGFTGLPPLRIAFSAYIKERASSIVRDKDRDEEMIERILELKSKMDRVVREFWAGEVELARGLKDAMESAINQRARKPAEMIAKYVDAKLKSGNKTMSDSELEHALNEALILFRYVSDKDMFEEVYKRHFAKRLLLNQSASSDAEQSMLLKLKDECGPEFTQQLETMLKDIAISTEIMQAYSVVQERARAEQQQSWSSSSGEIASSAAGTGTVDPFDLSVFVLTQAHWPTYAPVEVVIPGDMSQSLDRFAQFYQTRNSGRKLSWQHSLGTNIVRANIGKAGEKELMVSTFQTIVLLLFNDLEKGQTLSYKQIATATGLETKELKRTLQSLASGQIPTRVLRKVPQGKNVNETDEFHINESWKNERHRIRINQIQMKETEEEQQQAEARVLVDRELVLQAAAVRILKAKKTIRHNDLVNEVIEQVKNRFAVDVGRELKKTFELLIEKDYMERVENNRGMYRYVA